MKEQENILILDTETLGLGKPYMYDLGFIIARVTKTGLEIVDKYQFIIKEIYDNKVLFETAYYVEKRPKYIKLLQGRKAKRVTLKNAFTQLTEIIDFYNINNYYAYNVQFDKKVLEFNAEKGNITNPLENLYFNDIMTIAHTIHETKEYQEFCEINGFVSEKGYISTNAEKTFAYLTNNPNYDEPHLAVGDCEIELKILEYCYIKEFDLTRTKKIFIPSTKPKQQVIRITDNANIKICNDVLIIDYHQKKKYKNKMTFK
jgi:hypothetical protein